MIDTERRDDVFTLQVRLYRKFQVCLGLSPNECNEIYYKYGLFDYIAMCYEGYHMQGDEANCTDMLDYVKGKGYLSVPENDLQTTVIYSAENEFAMELLAAMASANLAKQQKISKTKAFTRFMKSKTAEMLFDESTYMWMNGPDYIADEYRRELRKYKMRFRNFCAKN